MLWYPRVTKPRVKSKEQYASYLSTKSVKEVFTIANSVGINSYDRPWEEFCNRVACAVYEIKTLKTL